MPWPGATASQFGCKLGPSSVLSLTPWSVEGLPQQSLLTIECVRKLLAKFKTCIDAEIYALLSGKDYSTIKAWISLPHALSIRLPGTLPVTMQVPKQPGKARLPYHLPCHNSKPGIGACYVM